MLRVFFTLVYFCLSFWDVWGTLFCCLIGARVTLQFSIMKVGLDITGFYFECTVSCCIFMDPCARNGFCWDTDFPSNECLDTRGRTRNWDYRWSGENDVSFFPFSFFEMQKRKSTSLESNERPETCKVELRLTGNIFQRTRNRLSSLLTNDWSWASKFFS